MATRKVKHARAMAKREKFLEDLKFSNTTWLKKAQQDRIEERQKAEEASKQKKIDKSKRLAAAHRAKPGAPNAQRA